MPKRRVVNPEDRALLTLMLFGDGRWGIERAELDKQLASGIQYQALVGITREMLMAVNELVDLIIETRLATEVDQKPIMVQPRKVM
jgi:hypothetical protein